MKSFGRISGFYCSYKKSPAILCLQGFSNSSKGLLSNQRQLINQVFGTGIFINDKKHVTNINIDGALQLGFEGDVAAHGFPIAIESDADKFTISINNRASGVTAGNVVVVRRR